MTDIILSIIILALLGWIYVKDKEHNKQVNNLLKAILSKNAQDYRDLTIADNTTIKVEPNKQMSEDLELVNDLPEYVSLAGATNQQFDDAIKHELEARDTQDDEEESAGFF